MVLRAGPVCLVLALAACGGSGAPPAVQVTATRELGPLPFAPVIRGRDGGFSAGWAGRSVWVFGDTVLSSAAADGETWRSSTVCTTADLDANDGLSALVDPADAAGAPGELMPFTAAEQAFNDAHFGPKAALTCADDCGARWALWPGPIVVDPAGSGGALVFYGKVMARPGAFNFSFFGTSVATWASPDARPVRPALRADAAEPTLLFGADEPNFAAAALTVGDDLYAYACSGGFDSPCVLARAPFARATERAAWSFFSGGGWEADARAAKPVFEGATMMTVEWNAAADAFLAIYSAPASSDVVFRTAPAPEGPWSEARLLFRALPPTNDGWAYSGLAHGELARDGGLTQYVSYFRETGFLAGEMRLVEVELARRNP